MSTVRLECDGCQAPRQGNYDQTVDQLREGLADVGWWSNKATDQDVCPTCLARRGGGRATT